MKLEYTSAELVAIRILHMTVWNNGTEVESLYYTHDLQKNGATLFGQAAGRRAQYEYDPYGNPINTTGDAAGQNPYRSPANTTTKTSASSTTTTATTIRRTADGSTVTPSPDRVG